VFCTRLILIDVMLPPLSRGLVTRHGPSARSWSISQFRWIFSPAIAPIDDLSIYADSSRLRLSTKLRNPLHVIGALYLDRAEISAPMIGR
jgi:hypothetical protein